MKLSAIIRKYREDHELSQREFAKYCGLSNSYISFIEKENNPKTGKPMIPTIEQYSKIAHAMSMSLQQLFELLDEDSPVSLAIRDRDQRVYEAAIPRTEEARIISGGIDKMPPERREQALRILQAAFTEYSDFFKENENDDA